MKRTFIVTISVLLVVFSFAQRPSKEQIEADKKKYAEEKKKLDEQLSKMDPKARQAFDSMMNSMGMGTGKLYRKLIKRLTIMLPQKKLSVQLG